MANRQKLDKYAEDKVTEPMPLEDVDHTCIYTKDKGDPNFKYCIYCKRIVYRTNEEIVGEYGTALERKLRGTG